MNTYTKIWAVKVNAKKAPKAGDVVTITKKSGETKDETIATVLWSEDDSHTCAIARDEEE